MPEDTQARWSRVTEIVEEALRRPEARQRARYLKTACRGDADLRREVDELLDFEGADDGILGAPLLEPRHDAPPKARRALVPPFEKGGLGGISGETDKGQRIGPYRVERPLGDGGMGVVALAWDEELERHVALKLLRREQLSEELLRRFETERRILARLDHPHIARILGSGTAGDLPYFVMEYVEGEPIDTYCDRHRLAVEERVRLVLRIADALAEAHRNLVVHRDLKPGNVLVTPVGEPKVLDFGIAKELDPRRAAAATRTGHQPLTPDYASPEQVRGQAVTVATDVYSLGVLLYGLLCGHPPHPPGGDQLENARQICEDEPPPPSRQALLVREIWTDGAPRPILPVEIAAARSSDPKSLARHLRGDLDHIVARALAKEPRARYRSMEQLAEDLRRHLDGLPVRARHATLLYRARKLWHRRRWELVAALVMAALGVGSLLWLRGQGHVRAAREQERRAERQAAEAERQAQAYILFAQDLVRATDPQAAETLRRSGERARRSLADQPEILAHQLEALALTHRRFGDLETARRLSEESLELRRRVYPGDHRLVAISLNNLAALAYQAGDRERAEELYRQSLAMKRRLGRPPLEIEKVESNLAGLLAFRGEYEEAEAIYRAVLEGRRADYQAGDSDIATSLRNLGHLLFLKGDLEAARAPLLEALELRRAARGERSTAVASVLASLGRLAHARGRLDEAEALLVEALAIRRQRLGRFHLHVALTEKDLAAVYFDLDEDAVAEVLWQRAQRVIRTEKAAGSWELADAESRLGARLVARGQREAGRVCLRESYETLRRTRGAASIFTRQARDRSLGAESYSAESYSIVASTD